MCVPRDPAAPQRFVTFCVLACDFNLASSKETSLSDQDKINSRITPRAERSRRNPFGQSKRLRTEKLGLNASIDFKSGFLKEAKAGAASVLFAQILHLRFQHANKHSRQRQLCACLSAVCKREVTQHFRRLDQVSHTHFRPGARTNTRACQLPLIMTISSSTNKRRTHLFSAPTPPPITRNIYRNHVLARIRRHQPRRYRQDHPGCHHRS